MANKSFGNATKLKYLGTILTHDQNSLHEEIRSQLNSENAYLSKERWLGVFENRVLMKEPSGRRTKLHNEGLHNL